MFSVYNANYTLNISDRCNFNTWQTIKILIDLELILKNIVNDDSSAIRIISKSDLQFDRNESRKKNLAKITINAIEDLYTM